MFAGNKKEERLPATDFRGYRLQTTFSSPHYHGRLPILEGIQLRIEDKTTA